MMAEITNMKVSGCVFLKIFILFRDVSLRFVFPADIPFVESVVILYSLARVVCEGLAICRNSMTCESLLQ